MYTHGSELIGSHLDMGYFQCGVVFLTSALNISDYQHYKTVVLGKHYIHDQYRQYSQYSIEILRNVSPSSSSLKCYLIIGIDLNARSSSPLNISQAGLSGR